MRDAVARLGLDARQFLSREGRFCLRLVALLVFLVVLWDACNFFDFSLRFSQQFFAVLPEGFAALVCGDGIFELRRALLQTLHDSFQFEEGFFEREGFDIALFRAFGWPFFCHAMLGLGLVFRDGTANDTAYGERAKVCYVGGC